MPDPSECPAEAELHAFVQGKRQDEEVERVAGHIEICEKCAETAEHYMSAETLFDPLPEQPRSADAQHDRLLDELIEKLVLMPSHSETFVGSRDATPFTEGEPTTGLEGLAPATLPDELGRLATYRVLRVLGSGGMGIVFQAEDLQLRRPVALKVMNSVVAANPLARKRFQREAQLAAAVTHDNIVSIFQVGEDRGIPFLAMPLLVGESLEERLRRVGELPVADVLRIGREIAEGLAAAHQRGLIHRDIKPANVFLESGTDRVKLVDFGLAREVEGDARLTHSGMIMGTPAYMAPEQARGEAVDGRADLFSLGCVLYRACTGRGAFNGPDIVSTLSALALTTPAPPCDVRADIPQGLSDLIVQLLAKRPSERPDSARLVADRIAAIQSAQTIPPLAHPVPAVDKQSSPVLRPVSQATQWWRSRVAMATLLLLIGGGVLAEVIIIKLRDKDGNEVKIQADVKPGSTLIVEQNGNVVTKNSASATQNKGDSSNPTPESTQRVPIAIIADAAPEISKEAPLGPLALVRAPETISRLQSWTIETRGCRGDIRSVAYSGDGKRVATSSADGTLRVFDSETGRLLRAFVDPEGGSGPLAWSPDDRTLATTSDKTVRLWEVESGRLLRSRTEHTSWISAVAWSPNGALLATGSHDRSVRLWNVADGRLRDTLQSHAGTITAIAWSPDSAALASASEDRTIRFWDAENGHHRRALESQTESLRALAWSKDGATLASAGEDKSIRKWNIKTSELAGELEPLPQSIRRLVWLADGKTLGVVHGNGTARIVDSESGRTLREVQGQAGEGADADWSLDGRRVAFGSGDGTLRVWEVRTGKLLSSIAGHKVRTPTWNYSMPALAWSPDGKILAVATLDSRVLLWEPDSRDLIRELPVAHAGPIVTLAWSPDGKLLSSGGSDNTIRIWNLATAEQIHTCNHSGWIAGLAWSPDGKTLASGGQDSTVRLWEVATWRELHKLEGHKSGITALAWSPDSKRSISGSYDQTLRIWDAATGEQPVLLDRDQSDQPLGENRAAAWSPDGKLIAAGGAGLWLWDAESGKIVNKLPAAYIRNVAWSSDGKTLATGFADGTARTWNVDSGTLAQTLAGHGGPVEAVSWAPNGKILACGSTNYWAIDQIRVWDAPAGRLLAGLTALSHANGLAINSAGHVRATPEAFREIVYVVMTDHGQETLTPEQFGEKYGCKNDPARVRLTAEE